MKTKENLRILKEYFLIFFGTIIMSISIVVFFEPNGLVVGGFSGLGIIIQSFSEQVFGILIPIWVTNSALNLPLFIVGAKLLGISGLKRTLFATVCLSLSLYLAEFIPPINIDDLLLTAIFGGVIEGFGLGIIFRYSATTGGSDLVASIMHKYHKQFGVSKIMFVVDTAIIILGLFTFGAEKAMYAIIAAFVVSKVVNTVLEGLSFAKAAFIISDNIDEIADRLLTDLSRGATGLYGKGMFTKQDRSVILCVVSTKEIAQVKEIVAQVDSKAFVIVADVREVLGEGFEPI